MANVHKPHDHYPFENASENKSGDFKVGYYYKHGFSNSRKSKIIFTACSEQQKIIFGHLCTQRAIKKPCCSRKLEVEHTTAPGRVDPQTFMALLYTRVLLLHYYRD